MSRLKLTSTLISMYVLLAFNGCKEETNDPRIHILDETNWKSESTSDTKLIRAVSSKSGAEFELFIVDVLEKHRFTLKEHVRGYILTDIQEDEFGKFRLKISFDKNVAVISGDKEISLGNISENNPIRKGVGAVGDPFWERMFIVAKRIGDQSLLFK